MQVLIVSRHFAPGYRAGGVLRSVVSEVARASSETTCWVLTSDRDLGSKAPYPVAATHGWQPWQQRHHVAYTAPGLLGLSWMLRLGRKQTFDLIYINGLWHPRYSMLPALLTLSGIWRAEKVVVAPRGQLSDDARALGSRLKPLALRAWRFGTRMRSITWHASSPIEAEDCRLVSSRSHRIISVLDPVELPKSAGKPHASDRNLRITYVGRVTRIKNLHLVLEAIRNLPGALRLDVVGPVDDVGYWADCQKIIDKLPPDKEVVAHGAVEHTEVLSHFAQSDLFVFPTASENFGHVIVESLSMACPIVVGSGTPWSQVVTDGGGQVLTDLSAEALRTNIDSYLSLSRAERLARSAKAASAYNAWIDGRDNRSLFDLV